MMTQGQNKENYESVLPITTESSSTLDTEIKLADLSELKHPVLSFMVIFATHACGQPCITYMKINHVVCTCQCLCQERMWQLLPLFILLLV